MKVQIYGKMLKALKSVHPKELKGHALKRVLKMTGLITGMIRYQSSHLAKLGKGLPQQITAHGKEKAAGIFLANKWIDMETHYLPFLKDMLPGIVGHSMKNGGVRLIIDGSQMGNKHCTLMVSVAFRKRSIPLLWLVKKQPKCLPRNLGGTFRICSSCRINKGCIKVTTSFITSKYSCHGIR